MLRTFVACSLMLGASVASADVLLLDGIVQSLQTVSSRPMRGMSMDSVEASFGAPAMRHTAVGDPPIARWDYPGFIVYFEHRLVLHAVAAR